MRRRLLACLPLLLALAVAAPRTAVAREYAAVFSFGDSLSDTGNLCVDGIPDYLATARSPYGMTYFGYPTGRVSDGRVVIDFIAQELGLPLLPPSKAKNATFRRGANFAITGATALGMDFFEEHGLARAVWSSGSLHTQIGWFRDMKPSICSSPQECRELFRRSLFVVGEFGGSDYGSTIFSFRPLEEVHALVPHVVGAIARGVEELIAEGAVDLVVPGLLPTGCFPMFLSTFSDKPPAEPSTIASCSPIGRVTARRWRRTGRVAQERRGGDVTTGGATRRAGAGVRNQVSAAAGELGAVRDEVRERSGGVNAWAVGSGAGAHRGRAGAEEPKAAGGELRTCSIGLYRLRRKKVPSDLQLGPTQPPHMPLCVKG